MATSGAKRKTFGDIVDDPNALRKPFLSAPELGATVDRVRVRSFEPEFDFGERVKLKQLRAPEAIKNVDCET